MVNTPHPEDKSQKEKEPLTEHPSAPPDFHHGTLPISEVQMSWYRLNPKVYNSALFFDKTGNGRFDGKEQGYGILYLGENIQTTFIECFGRQHGAKGVAETDLRQRILFEIKSTQKLKLVDLWGSGLVKIGADARITSGSYLIARQWAKAIFEHPLKVDGIRYYSRHDNTCLCSGLFDRSQKYLRESNLGNLIDNHGQELADILNHYDYGLF
jgi:hypothetical protein